MTIRNITLVETTPDTITEPMAAAAAEVGGSAPHFVPVRPAFDAKHADCYDNVKRHIAREGGDSCFGWQIDQEAGRRLLILSHHAIWKSPAGELISVTPTRHQEPRILFSAGAPAFTGSFIGGRLFPTSTDERVIQFCEEMNSIITYWNALGTQSTTAVADRLAAARKLWTEIQTPTKPAGPTLKTGKIAELAKRRRKLDSRKPISLSGRAE